MKTQAINISGTFSKDKRRVEAAVYSIDGVKSAVWDEYTQLLTVKYSVFANDARDKVQKKLAGGGNDT